MRPIRPASPFALALVFLLGWTSHLALPVPLKAAEPLFQDDFRGRLGEGWSWIREEAGAWRVTERGLELRILPGNLWGGRNNAKNLLVRPAPDTAQGELEIAVTVENRPTGQYEQVGLAWYYDDSHMVKLVRELVDGTVRVCMGREQADRTRTLGLVPVEAPWYRLRLLVAGNQIRGQYRAAGSEQWLEAGAADLPAPPGGEAKIILHSYNGPADAEHWAKLTEFRVTRREREKEAARPEP
ncbi:MAG: DUF1349 domain-containing protein [Verrucomicrobia bacterium]|nr:DUF1349 domain-containing protein [Verrucomicrobiota bacterium]